MPFFLIVASEASAKLEKLFVSSMFRSIGAMRKKLAIWGRAVF